MPTHWQVKSRPPLSGKETSNKENVHALPSEETHSEEDTSRELIDRTSYKYRKQVFITNT